MLTVCPKCSLTLAVTAVDLRLGQGYVRCGRCGTVFNALVALTEESAFDTDSTRPVRTLKIPGEQEPAEEPDIFLVAPEPESPSPPPSPPPATSAPESVLPLPTPTPEPAPEARPLPEAQPALATAKPLLDDEARSEQSVYLRFEHPPIIPQLPPATRQPESNRLVWVALAACCFLLLVGQTLHHWRNELAADARFFPYLSRVYSFLQISLTPRWRLAGYDLRQLGTASYGESDQTVWIRIKLANSSLQPLPWPKLRLSLSDKFGKRLSTRILEPRDYLRDGKTPASFMPPGQHLDTEVGVVNPLSAASSFELDVCTPMGDGLRCASDETLRGVTRS